MKITVIEKNVYGNILVYPFDEKAKQFADLLNVKSFSHRHLCKIEAMGYVIDNVTPRIPA